MIKQYVVFGDSAANRVSERNWAGLKRIFEDSPNSIGKRVFNTEKERRAYLCGLEDATGWMESYPLDADEARGMSRQIPLSDIHDLSDY